MKFSMRIFGEIQGFNAEDLAAMDSEDVSPFELKEDSLLVEYEGPFMDAESVLEKVEPYLRESCSGHLDFIDHDNWEIVRCVLVHGAWNCKKNNVDNVLEAYK